MTKTILRLTLSGIFAVLTGLLVLAAVFLKAPFFEVYPEVSRWIVGALAKITSIVPVPLWEILALLLIALFIFTLVRAIIKRRMVRWLTGLLLIAVIFAFAFVAVWGLNYYAPPMAQRLGLEEKQFSREELQEATVYYRDRANELAPQVQRDENGKLLPWDFDDLAKSAPAGYQVLAQNIDMFDGSLVPPKKLALTASLMGKTGYTGITVCLTGESCVSPTTYQVSQPFTMCHEMGHRMALAREDEANFAGFLACTANPRTEFQYSGYYNAFKYCYNALYDESPDAAAEVWSGVCPELAGDNNAAAEHYEELEDETASQVADTVYNGYLHSFSVESGVKSYGEVTDLLILWYQQIR